MNLRSFIASGAGFLASLVFGSKAKVAAEISIQEVDTEELDAYIGLVKALTDHLRAFVRFEISTNGTHSEKCMEAREECAALSDELSGFVRAECEIVGGKIAVLRIVPNERFQALIGKLESVSDLRDNTMSRDSSRWTNADYDDLAMSL